MLVVPLLLMALQINWSVSSDDVRSLLKKRTSPPAIYKAYGNGLWKGVVVSTPQRVMLSLRSSKLHLFLHDGHKFRTCLWDGHVTFDEKKEVVLDMLQSLNLTGTPHEIYTYEDGVVFADVMDELENF